MNSDTKFAMLAFGVPTAFLVMGFYVAMKLLAAECEAKWTQYQPTYTFVAGCMITFEGHRIPADRVWFEPKN